MANVIVWGTADFSQLAHFYLTHDSPHTVVAFTVDAAYKDSDTLLGLPVVPVEDLTEAFPPALHKAFVPISPARMNAVRAEKYHLMKSLGYQLVTYISSKATYYDTPVGDNGFIFENNVIQPFTTIGNNVTMWSGNHIGHHSVIDDHCFLSSHVVISGHCHLKPYCFLGVNATLKDGVTLAQATLVGAHAYINDSTVENGVYPGEKAQPSRLKSHQVYR